MHYQEALDLAAEYDDKLHSEDPRFRRSVNIIHEDGSYLHFDSSFLMKRDKFIFLFAEHYSPMVFDKDDLVSYCQFQTIYSSLEEF